MLAGTDLIAKLYASSPDHRRINFLYPVCVEHYLFFFRSGDSAFPSVLYIHHRLHHHTI